MVLENEHVYKYDYRNWKKRLRQEVLDVLFTYTMAHSKKSKDIFQEFCMKTGSIEWFAIVNCEGNFTFKDIVSNTKSESVTFVRFM